MQMNEIEKLKNIIAEKDREIEQLRQRLEWKFTSVHTDAAVPKQESIRKSRLSNDEIYRYSRQLILPEIGVKGQVSLGNTSVLIVGAGGLGCPAAVYLAAAGIGTLGVVDYDEVELSNLHRQILHTESRVGVQKSISVVEACSRLNSHVKYVPYHLSLDSSNALQIIQQYDIVLDATDNVATRYLLNDACVLAKKPLVSGSALRFEGQLTVYNYKGGPCYRCLFPKPPAPEIVTNCSDGGVLGVNLKWPMYSTHRDYTYAVQFKHVAASKSGATNVLPKQVPGIIGSLQALEAIKIAAGIDSSFCQRLLMFDGLDGTFRSIKLRGRQPNCPVCGDEPTVTQLIDYEQFCGARATDKNKDLHILQSSERISVQDYKQLLELEEPHLLIDVRQRVELEICCLPADAMNITLNDLDKESTIEEISSRLACLSGASSNKLCPVICVCRRGNDSQIAVKKIKEKLGTLDEIVVKDIAGGLTAWAKVVHPGFPIY